MRDDELLYRIALTLIPELGPVCGRSLIEHFGEAGVVFRARKKEISAVEGIGEVRAKCIKQWNAFDDAAAEIVFIEKNGIVPLFITDIDYPKRLLHCYDPPLLLYYRGTASLNSSKIISIIGTRNHTDYGRQITEQLVTELAPHQALIVSGLAFGVDALAHRTALQHGLPTVGVLAHGMHMMYPMQHRSLAKEMIQCGGLLTEFGQNTKPDKHNFPRRNRIVAGMADAVVVIETAVKGGSMITAELAHNYNRDVFAVPGRVTDNKSGGCLKLIQQNKAMLFNGVEEMVQTLGWKEISNKTVQQQRKLFVDLDADEQVIVQLLQQQVAMSIDDIYARSGLSSSSIASAMLNLEMKSVINSLPGKMYRLL